METNELYKITFSKPYVFEGETYDGIDLSACEDLTGNDAAKAEKILTARGENSMFPEASSAYAFVIASLGTGKPVEFFQGLPLKDSTKVKNRVRACFL
jgi:hypothetical protein